MMRPIAAAYDLTPARFDLLYVLHGARQRGRYQCYVARRLGVSRSTVCKMVRALEQAGLLERHVAKFDRRYRVLELTRYGRRCFARLNKALRRRRVEDALHRAIYAQDPAREARRNFLSQLKWQAARLARGLGDEALLYD